MRVSRSAAGDATSGCRVAWGDGNAADTALEDVVSIMVADAASRLMREADRSGHGLRRGRTVILHDTSRMPAAWIFSYTHSGRQRSVLSARQFEWQTMVATWKQRGKSNVVEG